MTGSRFSLEVQPVIPARLARLAELANDLVYSWDSNIRGLFLRLDPELWHASQHNPKLFLRRVSQSRLEVAAEDRVYMENYHRVLSVYDTYQREELGTDIQRHLQPGRDLVAYFCFEFGFHESLRIYSGGLGILAGDHCKAASDLSLPFVAVGMLYRLGYLTQSIDEHGHQVPHYTPANFDHLPLAPARDSAGNEIHVAVQFPGRAVQLRVWEAKAGHIKLYLLDSDIEPNSPQDRAITYQLYGGDINTRIQQELLLGIGGVRALRALGLAPTVWHINEGHAAFMILERCRERVQAGLPFDAALELIAASTVFTTHTPVAAGHDIFDRGMMEQYFRDYAPELRLDFDSFMQLGHSPGAPQGFNQTAFGLRGSRLHNGVSRIHGDVASRMEAYIWPQVPPEENPLGYVTNGVHVPTFLAREWINLFYMRFSGEWRSELLSPEYWERIDEIPDHSFWSLRQTLKAELLAEVRRRLLRQLRRHGASQTQIERVTQFLSPHETDILTLGFARRFATYKRATLLFSDLDRLARIINQQNRPVLILFAGKAHPNDRPGQHLIELVHEVSRRPEFEGRLLLLEDYDLSLSRRLVTGVDVWLNTPEYPLEASGTSGQKAAINGVINLSVLDGWWGEGYNGENGWAITPHGPQFTPEFRNRAEADELLRLLEHHVVPLYYSRDGHGYSQGWVRMAKASMKSIMPRFNAQRMVMDYVQSYYSAAASQHQRLVADEVKPARELAAWTARVRATWPRITLRRDDESPEEIRTGETLPVRVAAQLHDLSARDVIVECLVGTVDAQDQFETQDVIRLRAQGPGEHAETLFSLDLCPRLSGLQYYKLRMYPHHSLLTHRFELGAMLWV